MLTESQSILPIQFQALYQERVWGGRKLEEIYQRNLPQANVPYGESWEISDRPEAQSLVIGGKHHGLSLHELWTHQRPTIFGEGTGMESDRFPLLIKILDARDDLSIQVHPPAHLADTLAGEPKTEMWYIADADEDATLYVGMKNNVTKEDFETAIHEGTLEKVVHSIKPKSGESIFIPSGRLHAIGAGFLIYEIQQNSDTTYRVFDWNRTGLDGKPRELHIQESMQCIDFADYEPGMDKPFGEQESTIAECPFFKVEQLTLQQGASLGNPDPDRFSILTVVSGSIQSIDGTKYHAGDFLLLPRGAAPITAKNNETKLLQTTIPT